MSSQYSNDNLIYFYFSNEKASLELENVKSTKNTHKYIFKNEWSCLNAKFRIKKIIYS